MISVSVKNNTVKVKSICVLHESSDAIILHVDISHKYPTIPWISPGGVALDTPDSVGAPTQINLDLPELFHVDGVIVGRYSITVYCLKLHNDNREYRYIYG